MKQSRITDGNRIVVKIGTESLFQWEGGVFGGEKMEKACSDISHILHKTSDHVALVSSWAVGFGRLLHTKELNVDDLVKKQYLASLGQQALIAEYAWYFSKTQVTVGGIVVTHADIEDSEDCANALRNVLECYFSLRTLPIINENDAVSWEEMQALKRGADNDKNALLIARLIEAKALYIITNTNGVYQNKDNPNSRIDILRANELTDWFIAKITGGKSEHGTGGMKSKLEVAREAARYGIETRIIDGINSTIRGHYYNKAYGGTIILPE